LSVQILADMVKRISGPITGPSIASALKKTKDLSLYGMIPDWTPTKVWDTTYPDLSNPYVYLDHIVNGQIVPINSTPVNGLQLAKEDSKG
jgi:hypothetical protein